MHDVVNRLISIQKEIQLKNSHAEIVAVSKTFPMNKIIIGGRLTLFELKYYIQFFIF